MQGVKQSIMRIIAAALAFVCLTAATPVLAEESNQYPLKGTFPYMMMTEDIVNKRLAEGWVYAGDPYAEVGTAVPFTNNAEWVQVNQFKSSNTNGINSAKILLTLAGVVPTPDSVTGSILTFEEELVREEVIKYLNSYEWKYASEYEKAFYTAEYIANRCVYNNVEGDGVQTNSSYSCLVNGYSVCDGFAATYHLLTRAVGLKSIYGQPDVNWKHAINYVMVDGQWYDIDVSSIAQPKMSDTVQMQIQRYLQEPTLNTSYIWTERGEELEYDSTLPKEPIY